MPLSRSVFRSRTNSNRLSMNATIKASTPCSQEMPLRRLVFRLRAKVRKATITVGFPVKDDFELIQ